VPDDLVSADDLRRQLDEVRASRARVSASADAERRRIERGLHDSVQQDLIALAVNLQLAREAVDSDPAEARAFLDEASRDVHDALDSVRAIAHDVYPSLLIDRGLAEALRAVARTARARTQVEATADRFSPEIEAAVYFACVQAVEEADADRVHIRVWPDEGSLLFEVDVDGGGGVPDVSRIEDRVGAVAGSVSVSSEGGRFRLLARIPIPAPR
jgi:signal transduction histidine kinase